jgi:tRNA dimethylallyltransferase
MDAGTEAFATPERAMVRHHLIDIVDPDERYSAGRFRGDAIRAVEEILFAQAIPAAGRAARCCTTARLRPGSTRCRPRIPKPEGRSTRRPRGADGPRCYAELARVDRRRRHGSRRNDAQRIQRALEVFRISGRSISSLQTAAAPALPFE